jgi:hypothetical protein
MVNIKVGIFGLSLQLVSTMNKRISQKNSQKNRPKKQKKIAKRISQKDIFVVPSYSRLPLGIQTTLVFGFC